MILEVCRLSRHPDLALNPFTGAISGIPKKTGTFTFAIRLRDSDERTPAVTRELILQVDPARYLLSEALAPVAGREYGSSSRSLLD